MKIFLLTLLVYGLALLGLVKLRGTCGGCDDCPYNRGDDSGRSRARPGDHRPD